MSGLRGYVRSGGATIRGSRARGSMAMLSTASTVSAGSVHVWERRGGQCGDLFTGFMPPTLCLSTVLIRRPYDRKQYTTS